MLPSMALEITKIKHPLARQEAIPSYEIGLVGLSFPVRSGGLTGNPDIATSG
jgi:hypothetical protein